MKKLFTAFFLMLCVSGAMWGQTFMIDPATVQTPADPSETDVEAHVDITNLTSDDVTIGWERLTIEIGQGCETQVCDFNACYAAWIDSKQFILPGDTTGQIIMHFLNNTGIECCGIIHLKLTNLSNTGMVDTLTAVYLFNSCSSSTGNPLPEANVKLYPNPTVDYIQLENADAVGYIRVYDMKGELVSYLHATPNHQYNVSSYPAGRYILALEDENGDVFQAMEVVKN
jgi:hypothetical protein